jgi:hypothetical protein
LGAPHRIDVEYAVEGEVAEEVQVGFGIEEYEQVDVTEAEPAALTFEAVGFDGTESAERKARISQPEAPPRTILEIADRRRGDEDGSLLGLGELGYGNRVRRRKARQGEGQGEREPPRRAAAAPAARILLSSQVADGSGFTAGEHPRPRPRRAHPHPRELGRTNRQ